MPVSAKPTKAKKRGWRETSPNRDIGAAGPSPPRPRGVSDPRRDLARKFSGTAGDREQKERMDRGAGGGAGLALRPARIGTLPPAVGETGGRRDREQRDTRRRQLQFQERSVVYRRRCPLFPCGRASKSG